MRIALLSDEPAEIHQTVQNWLSQHGHEVIAYGAIATGEECPWAPAAEEAALSVLQGDCDEGIFFCWTGTGISIAANKLEGIRAALCTDPETAEGARIWNHANVLCLSNRSLTTEMAEAILTAWFDTEKGTKGQEGVDLLKRLDHSHRR